MKNLKHFSGHKIAASQMTGFGAMRSFDLDTERIQPAVFLNLNSRSSDSD
jgi:cystathionine beta-lyase/cystathionine gamma-synthase